MENTEEQIKALLSGRLTQLQLESLELIISQATSMTTRAKKAILWLLRQSDHMASDLAMTIHYKRNNDDSDVAKFAEEVAYAAHDFSNELYVIMNLVGLNKHIYFHGGVATQVGPKFIKFETGWDGGKQEEIPMDIFGYTIWIASKPYQKEVTLITFKAEEVRKSKLRKNYFTDSSSDKTSQCMNDEFEEDSEFIPDEETK